MKTGVAATVARPAREAIRRAAIRLFSQKGFAATSTREICEQAKVTKPVLYYHFGSKEQLYRELVVDAGNESRKQMLLAASRARGAREKLVEVLAADFEVTRRDPAMAQMFFRMLFAPRKETPTVDYIEIGMEWLRLIEGIASEGIRDRELKGKPREIAEALLGIHMIYTMGYLLLGEPDLDKRLAKRIVDLMLKGCGDVTDR
jgi:TetR/AcrR family transcriptional regulator